MPDAYTFTKTSMIKLKDDHDKLRTALAAMMKRLRGTYRTPQRQDYLVAKANATVAARTGVNMTAGTFTVQDVAPTGTLTDLLKTESVFNLGTDAIAAGSYVPIERDYITGHFVARAASGGGGGGAGGTVEVSYVKAQEYWQYTTAWPSRGTGGDMAWVSVKKCDQDGTGETGDAFDVWLPVPNNTDPNVVIDQVFCAAEFEDQSDSGTSWAAISDISDMAVGSVKMMVCHIQEQWGATTIEEAGWSIMEGDQPTDKTCLGNAYDMRGRLPVGQSTGLLTGTTAGTVGASDTTDSSTTGNTNASSTTGNTNASATASISVTNTAITINSSTTGIEGTGADGGTAEVTTETVDHEPGSATDEIDVVTEVTHDLEHSHTITDPGHTHTAQLHTHTATEGGHTHVVTDPGHTHVVTDPGHTHDFDQQGTLELFYFERINNGVSA